MLPRIPFYSLHALLERLIGRRSSDRAHSRTPEHGEPDDPCVAEWISAFREPSPATARATIKALRLQWLKRSILDNTCDLYRACCRVRASQELLRAFFSDLPGSPVGGGTWYRQPFDQRLEHASVTSNDYSRPPTDSIRYGPLAGSTLRDVEAALGPLEWFQVGHNDDESVFLPADKDSQLALRFTLSGEWHERDDGTYLHRLRNSAETRIEPAEAAVPEAVELMFLRA